MSTTDEKLDRIDGKLNDIESTLMVQQHMLDEHMRRTEILEGVVEQHKKSFNEVKGAMKLISGSFVIISVLIEIARMFLLK